MIKDSVGAAPFQSKLVTQLLQTWQRRTPTALLLGLEWMFLIGVTLTNLLLPLPGQLPVMSPLWSRISLWQVLTIAVFGLMGLKRPKRNLSFKILYTIGEFGLVYLPILLDARLSYIFPPLHLIIVIRSCSMFGGLGQSITTAVANFLFCITLFSQRIDSVVPSAAVDMRYFFNHMMFTAQLNAIFAFTLISAFILIVVNALFFVQRSRQELTQAHDHLRHYALQVEDQATLQERNRIARELHDALGHALIAQSLQLDTIQCFWNSDPNRALHALNEAKRLGSQALNDVRQAISTLRTDPLQGLPLDEAIVKLLQIFINQRESCPVTPCD